MNKLNDLILPEQYNYVAVFLTMNCNLKCSFCINNFLTPHARHKTMSANKWIQGLNRIISPSDLPITLQGGEPSLHPGFYDVINGIRGDLNIDLLTNIQFDPNEFMAHVSPNRLKRNAPYASIRISYHPEMMELTDIKAKVLNLLENGYSAGIWSVKHPSQIKKIEQAKEECIKAGIDFRFKEFLGTYNNKTYGNYKYPDAISGEQQHSVQCRTTELIIGPTGDVFRCHSDLYNGREPIGNICSNDFQVEDIYRPCDAYGHCNPCDVKTKTNRFQKSGHTSVDIKTN